jgi:hypothetical protein
VPRDCHWSPVTGFGLHCHWSPVAVIGDGDRSAVTGVFRVSVVPDVPRDCHWSPVTGFGDCDRQRLAELAA